MSEHDRIAELLAQHASTEFPKYQAPPPRKVADDPVMIAAMLTPEAPAKKVWYLPLAGKEHITYDSREEADGASVRLCVVLGLPVVTPLSRYSREAT